MSDAPDDRTCSNCGAQVELDAAFCENCGTRLAEESGTTFCEHCGAENVADAAACAQCGRPMGMGIGVDRPPPSGAGPSWFATHRRVLAAVAVVVAVLAVLVGVVALVATRDDDGGAAFDPGAFEPFPDATTSADEPVETTEESLPSTNAETELYAHIPDEVDDSCEADDDAPATAEASALCHVDGEAVYIQYWQFPDSETMYDEYDAVVEQGEQVTEGDCPDDLPSQTEWTEDDVTKGRWACYVTFPEEGDDAGLVWTHEDFLILSILTHDTFDADAASLVDYWRSSAGPE